jgi:TRAP-type C4-dicarboxylate transport system substrate-binding protein
LWKQSEEEALAAVEKAGVTILRPDKSLFADKVRVVLDSYREDPEFYALITQIQATE